MSVVRVRVNGIPGGQVDALDRGLCYGDGLFETMCRVAGRWPLWSRHMARLREGCRRLQLSMPAEDWLASECEAASEGLDNAVLRLTVTRGCGPRGYAAPADLPVTCIVLASPAPALPADWYHQGIAVHVCSTRLARQPRLAGIKHLNRLEQVLARSEWHDDNLVEGLVRDTAGNVVCATATNLFVVVDGELITPPVDACGVAGVARAEVLARCPETVVTTLLAEDLRRADEVFLTSSVRGVLPVRAIPAWECRYDVGSRCRQLQQDWREAGLTWRRAA